MQEMQLFDVPAAFTFSARLEVDGTWTLVSCKGYEGRPWRDTDRDTYSALSLAEAVDVIAATLFSV